MSQIGAPCPDHLINTKHKPLVVEFDPDTDGADELADAFQRGVAEYADWYRDYYERNVDEETRPVPHRPGRPARRARPRRRHRHERRATRAKARIARDLYHRAIAVQDAADALGGFRSLSESEAFAIEYWPLERYKLAQAPPRGELAGRVALDHRRSQRDRPRGRPPACRARGARGRRRSESARARRRSPTSSSRPTAFVARSPSAADVTDEAAVQRTDAQRGARVRRSRHPRRIGRPRDERADHRDDPRRVGAQLRRARARLLPRRARDVPGPARAGARRLGRLRRLEERARRRSERRRLLVGEGGVAAPRALPCRGRRSARHPRQHRQPGRRDPGLEHLVVGLEGRAGEHVRRDRGRPADLLPRTARSSGSTSTPRTSPRRSASSRARARRSPPETSSTSTAA